MKLALITLCAWMALLQTPAKLLPGDITPLIGKKWTGTLTYLDYSSGKPVNIPSELVVTASDKGPGIYNWATSYPKEPSHNSVDELVISKDGTVFDGETVTERSPLPDGILKFVAQTTGTDNGKKATYRVTYLIGKSNYIRKKEVRYDGDTAWFTRNTLALTAN